MLLSLYGAMVRSAAAKHGAILVDTQAAFDAVLAHCDSNFIAWDRVHPNVVGAVTLARAFLQSVGLPF